MMYLLVATVCGILVFAAIDELKQDPGFFLNVFERESRKNKKLLEAVRREHDQQINQEENGT